MMSYNAKYLLKYTVFCFCFLILIGMIGGFWFVYRSYISPVNNSVADIGHSMIYGVAIPLKLKTDNEVVFGVTMKGKKRYDIGLGFYYEEKSKNVDILDNMRKNINEHNKNGRNRGMEITVDTLNTINGKRVSLIINEINTPTLDYSFMCAKQNLNCVHVVLGAVDLEPGSYTVRVKSSGANPNFGSIATDFFMYQSYVGK